jgi:hypothetical protein
VNCAPDHVRVIPELVGEQGKDELAGDKGNVDDLAENAGVLLSGQLHRQDKRPEVGAVYKETWNVIHQIVVRDFIRISVSVLGAVYTCTNPCTIPRTIP